MRGPNTAASISCPSRNVRWRGSVYSASRRGRVGAEPPTRPLLEALYTLPRHLTFLEGQEIDAAVFGPLMDVAGYSLPPEQGAAWSRAQNEGLAASLAETGGRHVGLATVPL